MWSNAQFATAPNGNTRRIITTNTTTEYFWRKRNVTIKATKSGLQVATSPYQPPVPKKSNIDRAAHENHGTTASAYDRAVLHTRGSTDPIAKTTNSANRAMSFAPQASFEAATRAPLNTATAITNTIHTHRGAAFVWNSSRQFPDVEPPSHSHPYPCRAPADAKAAACARPGERERPAPGRARVSGTVAAVGHLELKELSAHRAPLSAPGVHLFMLVEQLGEIRVLEPRHVFKRVEAVMYEERLVRSQVLLLQPLQDLG
eukprot:CAMPEP_0180144374 /NCGR_PEP_ID=MMETSP0986-20121125/16888_1 /TAXON_ID=697907 /ORGANISM="non described non described, Strain CCMP2293" /LENGTH=258 /DNA_ID=CAMNT_0022088251 /DNA_START=182 /DNA_END=957 /DNA_ORIENTATION=-